MKTDKKETLSFVAPIEFAEQIRDVATKENRTVSQTIMMMMAGKLPSPLMTR